MLYKTKKGLIQIKQANAEKRICILLTLYVKQEEILGTAYLAALYLHKLNFKEKVYIVGPEAIADELSQVNIESSGCGVRLSFVLFIKDCIISYYHKNVYRNT